MSELCARIYAMARHAGDNTFRKENNDSDHAQVPRGGGATTGEQPRGENNHEFAENNEGDADEDGYPTRMFGYRHMA